MKLNIGCGEFRAGGWINMDIAVNDRVKPDLVGSLLDLPAEVNSVEAVYLGHVLEHISVINLPMILQGLWERCALGCPVAVVGPDVVKAWDMVIRGELDTQTAFEAAVGARRWPGDEHLWACTEDRLQSVLHESGLRHILRVGLRSPALDPFPVISRAEWQCAVVGEV